jgi:hypothetical protein
MPSNNQHQSRSSLVDHTIIEIESKQSMRRKEARDKMEFRKRICNAGIPGIGKYIVRLVLQLSRVNQVGYFEPS